MKVKLLLIYILTGSWFYSQYSDPNIAKPTVGYGADGTHTVGTISFTNPNFLTKNIEIHYPSDATSSVPTIFYSHAYGGNNSSAIEGLLEFVAKKGYAIVYVPYKTLGSTISERYNNLLEGFRKAARDYPNIIDTTQVGFMGHSFGGGASFGNAYQCFTEDNWGQNGRFIYALAQWYSFDITQTQLQNFPSDTKLLIEVFEDDETNDHRMAIDIFSSINIPSSDKDFLILKGDTINGYNYLADHIVPNTSNAFDAYDYYAYYRFIDALADYTFNGSIVGKDVALGNGSINQITMPGGLKALEHSDSPLVAYPESKYQFPCSDSQNLRVSYCQGEVSINENQDIVQVFPNPVSEYLYVKSKKSMELKLYDSAGQFLLSIPSNTNFNTTFLTNGMYFLNNDNLFFKFVVSH